MREDILCHEGDEQEWLIGSEADVLDMLGVSRPTLRQAARLLEQEQLLVVRRGVGGGLFGTRPTSEGVSSVASVFLRAQRTTFRDLLEAETIIGPACAELAARNPSSSERSRVRDFYGNRFEFAPRGHELEGMFSAAQDFQRLLSQVAHNPTLAMFVDVLMGLAANADGVQRAYESRDRRQVTLERHQEVADLVWNRDGELAAERMRKHLDETRRWMSKATLNQTLDPLPAGPSR
jgi:GntR family transcriptional regulator, transcriptional repressor for pyruvate dehydrogenase complex